MLNPEIFKAYDIRGVYPDEINEAAAYKIARAFVKFIKAKKIAVGYDMRISSKSIHKAMVKGLLDIGVDVYDLGLVPTPVVYFATTHLKLGAGVMITASHNPPKYGGIKFVDKNSFPIYAENGMKEIEELAIEEDSGRARMTPKEKGKHKEIDIIKDYIEFLKPNLGPAKDFNIVIDTMHGPMGPFIKKLFEKSKLTVNIISETPDENIPGYKTTNPLLEENRVNIKKAIKKYKADFGVMFDGDADRMSIVDKKGELVSQNFVSALIAKEVLSKQKGATVVGDIRASVTVKELVEKNGGKYFTAKAGNPYVKEVMKVKDAEFGFEISGHLFFKKTNYAEGSDMGLLYLINSLAKLKKSPQEAFDELKEKYIIEKEINYKTTKENILKLIEKQYEGNEIEKLDGISVYSPEFRFNIRKSNTEPLIRLNIEAKSKKTLEEKRKELEKFLLENGCTLSDH